MSALSIQPTFPIFTETDGLPLENGYIWIGETNLDPQGNPINVYWDAALTIQAAQPIRTLNGYPSRSGTPARLYVNSDYSIRVQNRNGSLVYSAPAATERYGNIINLVDINFIQAGTGAVTRTALAKMREPVTVQDFGASSSATAAVNTAAINAALASGAKMVEIVNDGGIMLVNDTISVPSGVAFVGRNKPIIKLANNSFPTGGDVVQLTSATDSVVDGITIDANIQNNGGNVYGVHGTLCVECSVRNCTVINAKFGIFFLGGNTLKFTGNVVDACTAYGICVKLNDVLADCYNIVVTGNECKNCWDGTTGGLTEGQGIIIYGATGATLGDYKNITKVIVNDNICHNNGRQGITLTAVNDFVVDGNNCYDNLQNTDLASGILISEACYNGTVTGNTCTNNFDAGILLDIADQPNPPNYFLFGRVTVTGNSIYETVRAGIKVNSCPFSTISGNIIDGRRDGDNTRWGIFVFHGGFYNIVGNNISDCSFNAIRLPGISGAVAPDQTNAIIADNIITNNTAPAGDVIYGAIYVDNYDIVKIQNNIFLNNTQDLSIRNTATNITLLDNRFTSNIYTDTSASIKRWEDEFRTTAAASAWFSAAEFAGSGMSQITLAAGFTIPHFGLQYLPIDTNGNNLTSSLTTAIYAGYFGQKIVVLKIGAGTLTIKQGANTDNIGNADVVLATGEMVEYTYTGALWLQTTAKIATSL
jgi:parallel beta-helix repeat protein